MATPTNVSQFVIFEVMNLHSEFYLIMTFCSLVVQEAVQFCVTVCEFSVANSISGVRKMLPLVWSTDTAIKDAVVQAYRRLYLNPQGDTVRSVRPLYIQTVFKKILNVDCSNYLHFGIKYFIYCEFAFRWWLCIFDCLFCDCMDVC